MACITITTKGIAQFTDPVVEAIEVGSNRAVVSIRTTNTGTATGSANIEVTLDGRVLEVLNVENVAPNQTWTRNYEISNLTPNTRYTICANLRG